MKRSIIGAVVALTVAATTGIALAQDLPQTANQMQQVTVTANPHHYETYDMTLAAGFGLQARVGNTRREYMEAWRETSQLERQRMQGHAKVPLVAVAIDNSASPGTAWQYVLSDAHNHTLAIVNVYCKRAVSAGNRCRMVSLPVAGAAARLAAMAAGQGSLAQVQLQPGR